MDRKKLGDKLLQAAMDKGFSQAEVNLVGGRSLEVRVYEGDVSHYESSMEQGISFRGLHQGKMGYAYSEKMSESVFDWLLTEAKANACVLSGDEKEDLFAGAPVKAVENHDADLAKIKPQKLIDVAKDLEQGALAEDKRIQTVEYAVAEYMESSRLIQNTLGLSLEEEDNLVLAFALARARDEQGTKQGMEIWQGQDLSQLDGCKVGAIASQRATSLLGAHPIASGPQKVLLEARVAAELLQTFLPVFFADKVQQGLSLMAGKKGQKVASDRVHLVDDPFHGQSFHRPAFDSEGVPTQCTDLLRGGRLESFLHSRRTAAKDKESSTGNGFKPSWKAKVEVAATNSLIVPGKPSLKALQESMGHGFQVTSLSGLHAGTNLVSGDFSLSAEGFWLDGGKIEHPVDQVTIAGNFHDLLKQVESVGNDLYMGLPRGSGLAGSPSLLIESLSISGN